MADYLARNLLDGHGGAGWYEEGRGGVFVWRKSLVCWESPSYVVVIVMQVGMGRVRVMGVENVTLNIKN